MKKGTGARVAVSFGAILLLFAAIPASAADHPAVPKGECLSCHVEMARGQSVHFDFTSSCTSCHAVKVEEGKTSITLTLPKEKICYSCHEKAEMDRMHMKGECLSCHDAHSSQRLYLLRWDAKTPKEKSAR